MSADRAQRMRRVAIVAWFALIGSIASWPFAGVRIGWPTAALALLPMCLPLPGIFRGRECTLRWAPLALAPAIALALTEVLVNPRARTIAALTLFLVLAAFAAAIAALRALRSA